MLPGACPGCGLRADLDVFAAQAEAGQALAAALLMPVSIGRRALAYLRLFTPEQKTLSLSKAGRLLAELHTAVTAGQVRRHGVDRAAPLVLWEIALDTVVERPPEGLPLRDHAYLFQTVWNLAEKAAARDEQAAMAAQRHRPVSPPVAPAAPVAPPPPVNTQQDADDSSAAAERRERNARAARSLLQTVAAHCGLPVPSASPPSSTPES